MDDNRFKVRLECMPVILTIAARVPVSLIRIMETVVGVYLCCDETWNIFCTG